MSAQAADPILTPEPAELPRRLVLVDAGSVYHPAYHVLSGFATRDGFPTGAVYGFTRTVLKLLRELPACCVGVAFDAAAPTHRHDLFAGYKADRPALPDDLLMQLPLIEAVVDALGLPRFVQEGLEADDLIASLAFQAREAGWETFILSGDKDLLQLVDARVRVLKPARPPGQGWELFDPERVRAYLGVAPDQVADFLALVGDASDQIPGVPGIGQVTARKLLARHRSLAELLAHPDRVENARARRALEAHRERAELSYRLAVLRPLAVGPSLADCRRRPAAPEALKDLFEKLEFHSLLKEFGLSERRASRLGVRCVQSEEELAALCDRLRAAERVSLDLETTSTDERHAEIVGIALAFEEGGGYYVPLGHERVTPQLETRQVLQTLRPFFEGEPKKIGQNLKFDAKVLRRYGIALKPIAFDAMLASYLLDPAARQHGLEAIARRFLGEELISYAELSETDFRRLDLEEAARYAVEDAEVVVRLYPVLVRELEEKALTRVFTEVELPLIDVLVEMELQGMPLDPQVLNAQGAELEKRLDVLRAELTRLAGEAFNPNSPKQVAHVLFEVLKLPVLKRTKTGPSTDAGVLTELADRHELPRLLLQYRELEKLLNTYIRKLPAYRDPETGRVYTSFNQTATATGRLSSSEPNLQNIPVRTELGGEIRRAFCAPPGRLLLGADYSQIELRVLAHLSEDEALIETFRRGEDLHERTARELFGVTAEEVGPALRTAAKRVNFGILYGISAYRLARELGLPQSEAQRMIDRFFQVYPGVRAFVERQVRFAREHGYVTTLLGRRRYLPAIRSRNFNQRSFDERNAVNAPIQGTAADLMKLAMIAVHRAIAAGRLAAAMLLQVHDELVFEVDAERAREAGDAIRSLMEGVMRLHVPLRVEIKTGPHWGAL